MKKVTVENSSRSSRRQQPALDVEAREKQMISLAEDLAEEQLRNGTASSQVITHYLKLGTMREKLEREKLQKENELLIAKTEAYHSAAKLEELYEGAIAALRGYSGQGDVDDD